jgi:hypothetical protein
VKKKSGQINSVVISGNHQKSTILWSPAAKCFSSDRSWQAEQNQNLNHSNSNGQTEKTWKIKKKLILKEELFKLNCASTIESVTFKMTHFAFVNKGQNQYDYTWNLTLIDKCKMCHFECHGLNSILMKWISKSKKIYHRAPLQVSIFILQKR